MMVWKSFLPVSLMSVGFILFLVWAFWPSPAACQGPICFGPCMSSAACQVGCRCLGGSCG